MDCPRCPAVVETARALEAHLVEQHLMGAAQAKREATAPLKIDRSVRQAPVIPAPPVIEEHHACPKCGAAVTCDLGAILAMEQQAHRLKILAGMWKARLGGAIIGRPRRNTFDVATARQLVAGGMTYQAVAEALGATSPSAVKSALTRARGRG